MSSSEPPPRPWRPSGVVSLLTDFGLEDPYVGTMHAVLWREASRLRAVVDLTHAVPPGDVRRAGFFLERSWGQFPAGTVHVAVVDPGVGGARELLVVEARGHVFLAPDNGLLSALLAAEKGLVRRADARAPVRGSSRTFHGRDRFAPLAARLVEGDPPASFGELGEPALELATVSPARDVDGHVVAEVVHVDRFGNLITNLPASVLASSEDWRRHWECRVAGRSLAVVGTYGEAEPRAAVALVNSYERLEVAVRDGSAARELALERGSQVVFVPRAAPTEANR
jgi:S-adenosylmethionine hydrolase